MDGVHADLDIGLLDITDDTGGVEEGRQVVGDDSVTGPLAEEGDDAVASETIAGSSVNKQGSVIPPSLVGTVHLQMRLILGHLKLDPGVLWVTLTVVFGEDSASAVWLAVDVKPSWGLWEEPGTENDEHWEHHLETDWDGPRGSGSWVGETTTSGARGNQSTDWPEDVVQASDDSSIRWVRDLDDVTWTGGTENTDTETEEETTAHELSNGVIASWDTCDLNDNTEDNDGGGPEHGSTSSPCVDGWTDERNGDDRTDLVHGGHDTSPCTGVGDSEEGLEVLVGEKSTEERTIVTVGGRTAKSNSADRVELKRCLGECSWWVLYNDLA